MRQTEIENKLRELENRIVKLEELFKPKETKPIIPKIEPMPCNKVEEPKVEAKEERKIIKADITPKATKSIVNPNI